MQANVGQRWNFSPCSQNAVDELLKWENDLLITLKKSYFKPCFDCRQDKSKCLTEQIGPNKLDGITKNPKLFSVSRQCKEWLQDKFNTAAPFREVMILFILLQSFNLCKFVASIWMRLSMCPFYRFRQQRKVIVRKCGAQDQMAMMVQTLHLGQTEPHVVKIKCVSIWNVLMHKPKRKS